MIDGTVAVMGVFALVAVTVFLWIAGISSLDGMRRRHRRSR